ncbi:unnamed protein product [Sphenostylis stenocarpa]|uniref:Uncharacterized protein n=1 Tax=Sphenostylis stenocarpa TaxID=92480 RepID=A0AA86SN56_9FABA|nr:unnamed protein product [Sphenostylis stenocarpa]
MSTPSSHLKTSHPVQLFSAIKPSHDPPSPSSSALSSMKVKSLMHTLIVSHMCRIIRALSKLKAAIIQTLKKNQSNNIHLINHTNQKMTKKIISGSFRLHYNWCSSKSSQVFKVPSRVFQGLSNPGDAELLYEECHGNSQLAGYLRWLEEKVCDDDENDNKGCEANEIDMLAELFIADCHEKFRLEKQESDRMFHEMLARGM